MFVFIIFPPPPPSSVLTGGYSVLPQNPGMGFRPMPNIEKTMITYNMQDDDTIAGYKSNFHYFLQPNKTGWFICTNRSGCMVAKTTFSPSGLFYSTQLNGRSTF